jgi:hypothetical protein
MAPKAFATSYGPNKPSAWQQVEQAKGTMRGLLSGGTLDGSTAALLGEQVQQAAASMAQLVEIQHQADGRPVTVQGLPSVVVVVVDPAVAGPRRLRAAPLPWPRPDHQ